MALPNGSHIAPAATSGTTFGVQTVAAKAYTAVMVADSEGHLRGSLPAFGLFIPPGAVGASKVYFDLYNGTASNVLRLRKLFAIVATDVAVTGTVGVRLDHFRTSSAGTGGTAATTTASTSTTAPGFWALDGVTALPAGITARTVPTGGATSEQYYFPVFTFTEETAVSTHMTQFFSVMPELPTEQALEIPPGKGLKVVQGTVASVGTLGFLAVFSVE